MLKNLFKKFFYSCFSEEELINYINTYKIAKIKKTISLGYKSEIYSETEIFNLQNNPNKIIIGDNTHIRGELLIYPYGDGIQIGNYSYVGKNTIIRAAELIRIGSNVLIAHNTTIIDTDSHEIGSKERAEGFKNMLENGHPKTKGNIKTKAIIIEDNVWISYNVSILKGVTIGEGAIIAAGAVVTKDVPPFTMVAGNPARIIKTLIENETI